MASDIAQAFRASAATRVVAMLTPSDTSEVAVAMAAPPIVRRAVVRESRVPISVGIALVFVGVVLAMLFTGVRSRQRNGTSDGTLCE